MGSCPGSAPIRSAAPVPREPYSDELAVVRGEQAEWLHVDGLRDALDRP